MFGPNLNNMNTPQGIAAHVEMYGKTDSYDYLAEKHSEVILDAVNCSQDVNHIPIFSQSEAMVDILRSNIDQPKQLPAGTNFLAAMSSPRFLLRKKSGQTGVITSEIAAKAVEFVHRAVLNFAPDQRNSFGQFKMAKHFPLLTMVGETAIDKGSVMATSANVFASTNVIDIPIPWQAKATLNAKVIVPKWEDATTEFVFTSVLSGRITEGPAN